DDGSMTKYFHLDDISVRNGQRVEAGQQVGTMGRTGNTPAHGDTHLHFELWRDGRKIDPLPELRGAGRGEAGERDTSAAPGNLRAGDRGPAVAALQEQLDKLGYKDAQGQPLARDGVFGDATRHAVQDMQRAQGLKPDGVVGPQSRAAMEALSHSQPAATPAQQGQSGFLDRMFAAARSGDAASVQQAISD